MTRSKVVSSHGEETDEKARPLGPHGSIESNLGIIILRYSVLKYLNSFMPPAFCPI